jgi:hypothetical protein
VQLEALARCPSSIEGERVRKIGLTFLGTGRVAVDGIAVRLALDRRLGFEGAERPLLDATPIACLSEGGCLRVFQKPPPLLSEILVTFHASGAGSLGLPNFLPAR